MASSQPAPGAISKASYAALGRRTAAYVIDVTIAFAVLLAATLAIRWLRMVGVWTPAAGVDAVGGWASLKTPAKVAVIIASLVSMGPIYLALFEASAWQASIGKRLVNIYVTDEAGRRVGLARSIGRSFAKAIFILLQVAFLSLFTILVSAKKQALHDFAAKTCHSWATDHGRGTRDVAMYRCFWGYFSLACGYLRRGVSNNSAEVKGG